MLLGNKQTDKQTQPCLYVWCQTVTFVQDWYQWAVSFHESVNDNFISYLDELVTPQATLPAVTCLLSFRLISMCVSWRCHLHTEMNLDFNIGHKLPKPSDEVGMCSGLRWHLKSRGKVV